MLPDFCFNILTTSKLPVPLTDIFGIDYGNKLAGTTVISFLNGNKIDLIQAEKGKDADEWILALALAKKPSMVFLDAPLSLPGVYQNSKLEDYFYRKADRELKAMSPMFLGGLTARAMRLKSELAKNGITVFETFPGYLAREILQLDPKRYKKDKTYFDEAISTLKEHLPGQSFSKPDNWHQFDALLAFTSSYRYQNKKALYFGDPEEGLIVI
jgi:predicted nuclease with RNAse H fold